MTVSELKHVEANLVRLGCPLELSTSHALQIIRDLEKSGTSISSSTFEINEEGILVIG